MSRLRRIQKSVALVMALFCMANEWAISFADSAYPSAPSTALFRTTAITPFLVQAFFVSRISHILHQKEGHALERPETEPTIQSPNRVSLSSFEEVRGLGQGFPVVLSVKGAHGGRERMQRYAKTMQAGPKTPFIPRREPDLDGFTIVLPLQEGMSRASALWSLLGAEPRGFAARGTTAIIGAADALQIIDLATGDLKKVIRNPAFGCIHTVEWSPFTADRILVTSSGVDRIFEIDLQTEAVTWEWNAWQQGYPTNRSGLRIVEKGTPLPAHGRILGLDEARHRMFDGDIVPAGEDWVVEVDIRALSHPLGLESHLKTAYPNWAGYSPNPGKILSTLFLTGEAIEIDRQTGAVTPILGNLQRPHGVVAYGSDYLVTDTAAGRVLRLDAFYRVKAIVDFSQEPAPVNSRPNEWLQFSHPIGDGLIASVDIRRSLIYVWHPDRHVFARYRFDPQWHLQSVLPYPVPSPNKATEEITSLAHVLHTIPLDPFERRHTALRLGVLGPSYPAAAQLLLDHIAKLDLGDYPLVRQGVIQALAYLGESARAALPSLLAIIQSPLEFPSLRRAAIEILAAVAADAEEAADPLLAVAFSPLADFLPAAARSALERMMVNWSPAVRDHVAQRLKEGPSLETDTIEAYFRQRMGLSRTLRSGLNLQAEENFRKAVRFVNAGVASRSRPNISNLVEIHQRVMNTLPLGWTDASRYNKEWGGYVRGSDPAVDLPLPARYRIANEQVAEEIAAFNTWYDAHYEDPDVFGFAAEVYKRLVHIHVFYDANGRSVRLFVDWILQDKGYFLTQYSEDYFDAIVQPIGHIRAQIEANAVSFLRPRTAEGQYYWSHLIEKFRLEEWLPHHWNEAIAQGGNKYTEEVWKAVMQTLGSAFQVELAARINLPTVVKRLLPLFAEKYIRHEDYWWYDASELKLALKHGILDELESLSAGHILSEPLAHQIEAAFATDPLPDDLLHQLDLRVNEWLGEHVRPLLEPATPTAHPNRYPITAA